jgi:hypothetical protein
MTQGVSDKAAGPCQERARDFASIAAAETRFTGAWGVLSFQTVAFK